MKKLILILLLISTVKALESDYVSAPKGSVADYFLIDSLLRTNDLASNEYVLYTFGDDSLDNSSVLFVNTNSCIKYWLIKRDSADLYPNNSPYIYKVGKIVDSAIFSYKNKGKCGVTKDESNLSFVPPLCFARLIIYNSGNCSFYFENGNEPLSYEQSKCKRRYRKTWIRIIMKEIMEILQM